VATPTTAACLGTHDDEVDRTRIGMELDDLSGVAVLFDCLYVRPGVLRAPTHVSHPLQPFRCTERERIITTYMAGRSLWPFHIEMDPSRWKPHDSVLATMLLPRRRRRHRL
jgi:hypothetical protein